MSLSTFPLRYLLSSLLLLCALILEFYISHKSIYLDYKFLAYIIPIDTVLGITLLYYLLIIKQKILPKSSTITVFFLAYALSYFILPKTSKEHMSSLLVFFPIIEGVILLYLTSKLISLVKTYRRIRQTVLYTTDALTLTLQQLVGDSTVVYFLVAEIFAFYYALFSWFGSFKPTQKELTFFTYHKNNSYTGIFIIFFFVLIVEGFATHLLLNLWSQTFAWIVTGSTVYFILWFLGDYKAIKFHPIIIDEKNLYLRIGLRWRATIQLTDIGSIVSEHTFSNPLEKQDTKILKLTLLGSLGSTNLRLNFSKPQSFYGLFGKKVQSEQVALELDDSTLFLKKIKELQEHY